MSKPPIILQYFIRLAQRRQIGRLIMFGPIFNVFLSIFFTLLKWREKSLSICSMYTFTMLCLIFGKYTDQTGQPAMQRN